MIVAIIVGGSWHAPQVAGGLNSLGHQTIVIDDLVMKRVVPVVGHLVSFALRRGGRFPVVHAAARLVFSVWAACWVHTTKADLIVSWSGFGLITMLTHRSPVLLVRGSHHIQTQRDLLRAIPGNRDFPRLIDVWIERAEYLKATAITVPTEGIAIDRRWGGAKMIVAPYAAEPTLIRMRASAPADHINLVFVGEPGLRKGIDRLNALDEIPQVGMVTVVGSSGRKVPNANSKVRYTGRLSHDEVLSTMSASHALVLLSREEGMARVGLEAISIGLPLLVTDRTGLGNLCHSGAGVTLPDDYSTEDLTTAVKTIKANWEVMSETSLRLAASWTWEGHANRLVAAIEG